MKVFLTGATGFLGSHVVPLLLKAGHQVVALVRDPERAGDLLRDGIELAAGDITDRESMRVPMSGCQALIHMAAWYAVGIEDPGRMHEINVGGTRNVLSLMQELGLQKGVYTSSLAVFGDTGGEVKSEGYNPGPEHASAYDRTKWEAHYEVALPMMEAGLPLVIVQPGAIYGPGDTSQSGELIRDYLRGELPFLPVGLVVCWSHIDDVARGHLLALERGKPGESYIIAGPCHSYEEMFTIAERITGMHKPSLRVYPWVARAMAALASVAAAMGVRLPNRYQPETLRVAAGMTYLGSNEKARRELEFEPRSLEEGLWTALPAMQAEIPERD